MEPFQILCSVAIVILALYYFFTSNLNFWKSRGVPGPRPIPGLGNLKNILRKKIAFENYLTQLYSKYKDEPLIGIFAMKTPVLIVKDPDLIKDIFIKDFSTFANRMVTVHEKIEPMSQHLFNLEIEKWRPLRAKLSPTFTSRKLKEMFLMISVCADHLVDYMDKLVEKNEPIECVELMAKYTTDVIGNCAFGIEMNALSDEDNEFRMMGRQIFETSGINLLRLKLREFSPMLYDIIGNILPDKITKFFMNLVVDSINYREKNNIVRNDFIDRLIELKKQSDYTDSFIASQAYAFFAAGFETSSTLSANALYELALNQKVQNRLREEIDEEYTKHGSSLTYDNIKKMNYLEKVFKETLRKYPAAFIFTRKSLSSYTFSGVNVSIPKNQVIWIPVFALQRDPHIYSEPDVFDPERFNEEAVQNRHPMFFLPFGDGPRNCIGSRFAIYQVKLGLIKILRNYKVEPCEKTEIPYSFDQNAFVITPKNGIHLKITKINQT